MSLKEKLKLIWRIIMGKDINSGNWFENQKEIADRVQNLDSDGNLIGDVTGNITTKSVNSDDGALDLSADSGTVRIFPDGGGVVEIINSTFKVTGINTEITFSGLYETDPQDAGVLWVDPSAGYALKVSQG